MAELVAAHCLNELWTLQSTKITIVHSYKHTHELFLVENNRFQIYDLFTMSDVAMAISTDADTDVLCVVCLSRFYRCLIIHVYISRSLVLTAVLATGDY